MCMTDINFYHLTALPLEKALPKLMEKVFESGSPALIQTDSPEQTQKLDTILWTYSTITFIPHGTKKDKYPECQPIYITDTEENPNQASILVLPDNNRPSSVDAFSRCLYMFDGNNDAELAKARERWQDFKRAGHTLVYWQQNAKGQWEKAA